MMVVMKWLILIILIINNKDCLFFLMVDRGNCKMIEKAKHASNIGASLLIIADNKDEDIKNHLITGQYEDIG